VVFNVACKLFNVLGELTTKVILSPIATVFNAVAVPVAIVVLTLTALIPVTSVPLISTATEQVPKSLIRLNYFLSKTKEMLLLHLVLL